MTVITSNTFPKALRPGIFAFTQMKYNEHPQMWKKVFKEVQSNSAYEEGVAGNTYTLMPEKTEGASISYVSESQAHVTRSTNRTLAMGYINTMEEVIYNKYEQLSKERGGRLAASAARTKETDHFNIFNRAHNGTYTFGDGSALCVTTHSTLYGNQSNTLVSAADMSEASIEDLCIQIMNATDNVGNFISLMPKTMIYNPALAFEACRILDSERQSGTANNDINALRSKGMIPEHFATPYLTDTDAFFIVTEGIDKGLVSHNVRDFKMDAANDTDTLNEKHYGYMIYSRTCYDHRAVFSNGGGA